MVAKVASSPCSVMSALPALLSQGCRRIKALSCRQMPEVEVAAGGGAFNSSALLCMSFL